MFINVLKIHHGIKEIAVISPENSIIRPQIIQDLK